MAERLYLCVLAVCVLCAAGCVERRLIIESDPPGAYVYLEGKEVGQTPLRLSFVHHGIREVSVHKLGYERVKKFEKIEAPWFQWFPLDFFFEVLWPQTLVEEHRLSYKLEPQKEISKEEVLKRAEKLRRKALHVQPERPKKFRHTEKQK